MNIRIKSTAVFTLYLLCFFSVPGEAVSDSEVEWDLLIPPGGYAYVPLDENGVGEFTCVFPFAPGPWFGPDGPALNHVLTDTVLETLETVPLWMRGWLRIRLGDLLSVPLDARSDAVPVFINANQDSVPDLAVYSGDGSKHVYLAPYWTETDYYGGDFIPVLVDINGDGIDDMPFVGNSGEIVVSVEGMAQDTLDDIIIETASGAAFGDIDSDGLLDLVIGTESGRIIYYRNRGTSTSPLFLPFSSSYQECFPMRAGSAVVPAFSLTADSIPILLTGNAQGEIVEYTAEYTDGYSLPQWYEKTEGFVGWLNAAPCYWESGEGFLQTVIGSKQGDLLIVSNGDTLLLSAPGTYTVPAAVDISGDDEEELLIGTREGGVWYLDSEEGTFGGDWIQITELPDIPSGNPTPWGDGIVFGCAGGTLRYFRYDSVSGKWDEERELSPYAGICVGEYSSPAFADIDRDGTEDLIVGNGRGILTLFMLENGDGEKPHFIEKHSWRFSPNSSVMNADDYYGRYFQPFTELRTPSDTSIVHAFCRSILNADSLYRDEIAYCIANSPTEVLREMYRNNDEDIFARNAEIVYETAEQLDYVNLTEETDGSTFLSLLTLGGWTSVGGGNYYRYTVHPRVMFEIPGRVNAEYWLDSLFSDSLTEEEVMRYEVDSLYGNSEEHVFWRSFIPFDSTYGAPLMESLQEARTYEEAVFRLSNYLSWCQPGPFMSFGYKSNDLQPMVIYAKAYGSCGEQSILQTALCRAMFIPSYVVGCRGEDHQWNQYLDPSRDVWVQWDINNPTTAIGHTWLSGEGVGHRGKTISTITAFSPDDVISSVTSNAAGPENSGYMQGDSGYTETAHVKIKVTDCTGVPVEGAMVLARSHWDNRNMVSGIKYTDTEGFCFFDLGWEPFGGYTIDIVSPFGMSGSSNLNVSEGEEYTIHYRVPGLIPEKRVFYLRNVSEGSSDFQIEFLPAENQGNGFLFPRSFYSGQLYVLNDTTENEEYSGAKWFPLEVAAPSSPPLMMDEYNLTLFQNGFNCEVIPFGGIEDGIKYIVLDNTGNMFYWREFSGSCSVSPFRGISHITGPSSAGAEIRERAPVYTPHQSADEDTVTAPQIPTVALYENQILEQDDPENPLSSGWVLGPFVIEEDVRSMLIVASGETSGLDMDLYLFSDKNGNRMIDGMEELEERSTSPTANETVFIPEPDPNGVYWILMQGWNVPDDTGYVNLGLSFNPVPLRITSLTPFGCICSRPEEYSFQLTVTPSAEEELQVYFGDSLIEPVLNEGIAYFVHPDSVTGNLLPTAILINADGVILETAEWSVVVDNTLPVVHSIEISMDSVSMLLNATICGEDDTAIESVMMHIEGSTESALKKADDSNWSVIADVIGLSGETCTVYFQLHDSAGNETLSEPCTLSVPVRPKVLFSSIFPQGIVFDHYPVIQVMMDIEDGFVVQRAMAVIADLSGNTICELQPIVSYAGMLQFLPAQYIQDGNYTVEILLFNERDEIESVFEWDFEIDTMEDAGYQTVWD